MKQPSGADARITTDSKLAALTLQTAQQNLDTAKLAHKKMVEQLSMRTATIAGIAGNLVAQGKMPPNWDAAAAVKLATEIMVEAETSAAKEQELQSRKDENQ